MLSATMQPRVTVPIRKQGFRLGLLLIPTPLEESANTNCGRESFLLLCLFGALCKRGLVDGVRRGVSEEAADRAMDRYADGDERACADVFDLLSPRLEGYVRRHAKEGGEDLVQEVFMNMHRARGKFVRGAPVWPWARAIAHHLIVDSARKRRPAAVVPIDGDEDVSLAGGQMGDQVLEAKQTLEGVLAQLARLPEPQRQAYELVKEQGVSLAGAAQVLGTTETAVKLRLHRAYLALRSVLKGN